MASSFISYTARNRWILLLGMIALLGLLSPSVSDARAAPSFEVIQALGAQYSQSPLIQAADGRLYGTTTNGGNRGYGTVFALAPDGTGYTVLHHFEGTDGAHPRAGLVQGVNGRLYGTTAQGGSANSGTVFGLTVHGTAFKVLHHFDTTNGGYPYAGLIQGADYRLYGTTFSGGNSNAGTVFALGTNGSGYRVLHHFDGSDGLNPRAELIQGADRRLYGTTIFGGSYNGGTLFALAANGSGYSVPHSFDEPNSLNPQAGLLQGSDGRLYGTTYLGGNNNGGTVFAVAPNGTGFGVLHSFNFADGWNPQAKLIQGVDGRVYGTTLYGGNTGNGAVYALATDGSGFGVLHHFELTQGRYPAAGLLQGADGKLYGTTYEGDSNGAGTAFALAADGSGYNILHGFEGYGGSPLAKLTQGTDGRLYGTTNKGGSVQLGTVFALSSDGTGFSVLHAFDAADVGLPHAGLIQDTNGRLYGTSTFGGSDNAGTVFALAADGTGYSVLHPFDGTEGGAPYGGLRQGLDGRLYGTTTYGGGNDAGTVFALNADGTGFCLLHSFDSTHGEYPYGGLTQGPDGRLYGTTSDSSHSLNGTVFALNPDGTDFGVLHQFDDPQGGSPHAGLILGTDGRLYGTTLSGNGAGYGTVFSLATDGSGYSVLHSFDSTQGAYPHAELMQGADGLLYGTTTSGGGAGLGTVFALATDGTSFSLLHSFDSNDGANPYGGLIQAPDGRLYGTTANGGRLDQGTIFRITVGKVMTSTNLTSNRTPSRRGQSVTFTATVTGNDPKGTVTFRDGGKARAIVRLNTRHRASFTTSKLRVGTHPMTAAYSGNKKNQSSISTTIDQVVQ